MFITSWYFHESCIVYRNRLNISIVSTPLKLWHCEYSVQISNHSKGSLTPTRLLPNIWTLQILIRSICWMLRNNLFWVIMDFIYILWPDRTYRTIRKKTIDLTRYLASAIIFACIPSLQAMQAYTIIEFQAKQSCFSFTILVNKNQIKLPYHYASTQLAMFYMQFIHTILQTDSDCMHAHFKGPELVIKLYFVRDILLWTENMSSESCYNIILGSFCVYLKVWFNILCYVVAWPSKRFLLGCAHFR